MMLGMRNRVDTLLRLLWPNKVPRPNSRYLQIMFLFIIGRQNYYIQQLRELIYQGGMTIYSFGIYVQDIYRDDVNQPVHTIKAKPCSPSEIDAACKAARTEIGDDITRKALYILFNELNDTKATNGTILSKALTIRVNAFQLQTYMFIIDLWFQFQRINQISRIDALS